MLATSGDYLRLWSLSSQPPHNGRNSITSLSNNVQPAPQTLTHLAVLSSSKSHKRRAPITSFDWNNVSSSLLVTSSFDTTCTVWDIPTLTAKTQLIAHDKEVFDVQFCANSVDVFLTCGADGSVRMFDIRSLEHSTIIYEPSQENYRSNSTFQSAFWDTDDSTLAFSPINMSPTTAPSLLRLAGMLQY